MRQDKNRPPQWADRLLEWYCHPALLEDLQGDLYERYERHTGKYGATRAALLYVWDVVRFIRPYTLRHRSSNRSASSLLMFSNYFKTSYRGLLKQRVNTIVTISGLTLGFSAFILLCLYVNDELKYDRYLANADRIYRITMSYTSGSSSEHAAWSEPSVGPALQERYPEIEAHTALVNEKITVKSHSEIFREEHFYFANTSFFDVFPYEFEIGDATTAFQPGMVVITPKIAKKYFSGQEPLDQVLEIHGKSYRVSGVLKEIPPHTDLKFDALMAVEDLASYGWTFNFVLFRDKRDAQAFQPKLDRTFAETLQKEFDEFGTKGQYHMEALPDVHFTPGKLFDTPKSSRANLYIFSTVALLMLVIAGINYMNTALVNATKRQAEVGIRKAVGAINGQLKVQFMLESVMVCTLSLLMGTGAALYCLPYMNDIVEKQIHWSEILSPGILLFLLLIASLLAVISASYPAMYLSSINPAEILKGKIKRLGNRWLSNTLIVVQFSISIVLIIVTVLIFRQLELIQSKSLGFDQEQVLLIDIPRGSTVYSSLPMLKNKLLEYPFVNAASYAGFNGWPTADMDIDVYEVYHNQEWQTKPFNNIEVDEDYFELLNLNLAEGRGFTPGDMDGQFSVVIVNQALVDNLGWTHPLEQTVFYENGIESQVIGVIEDFHFKSIRDEIEPMLIFPDNRYAEKLLLRVSTNDWWKDIELIESTWKAVIGAHPFEFHFLDQYVQAQYKSEQTMKQVFVYFMIIALSIACLGLFALIALTTSQRLKEVGIRKVFGARGFQLLVTLSKNFIVLVLIAVGIASVVSVWGMNLWLERFVYKTAISFDVFLLAGGLSILVAMATMSFHVIKASRTNPSSVLKHE